MNNSVEPKDWREEKTVYTDNDIFIFRILGAVLLVGIGVLIGWAVFSQPSARESYAINLFTDVLAIIVTVLVIDALNRRRDQLIRAKIEKEQLIDDMSSSVNDIAQRAVERLRLHGWLVDGSLHRARLAGARLPGAKLRRADLKQASLHGAILHSASLELANLGYAELVQTDLSSSQLMSAVLQNANLTGAILHEANLSRADLRFADLTNADLSNANLEYANLRGARLFGTKLNATKYYGAQFDDIAALQVNDQTILPNGLRATTESIKHFIAITRNHEVIN